MVSCTVDLSDAVGCVPIEEPPREGVPVVGTRRSVLTLRRIAFFVSAKKAADCVSQAAEKVILLSGFGLKAATQCKARVP